MPAKHFLFSLLLSCTTALVAVSSRAEVVNGKASYYADSLHGNLTASGEVYDKDAMTAAHRSLPFGTIVTVRYLKTGEQVEVTINDRGPYAEGVLIDLSSAAARRLGMIEDGVGEVTLEYAR